MYPVLFTWNLPEWLLSALPFLPESIAPKSYGTLIALGILAAWFYATREAKKIGIEKERITDMMLWLILAGFVGGKVLFYFEDIDRYVADPGRMFKNFGNGFVFYGSMIFAIPTMWWFFRKHKLPALKMLDIIAVGGALVHAFGRLGCFSAGCCHGVPTDSWLGVTFSNPACRADPLHTPLHPTQLYSVSMLLVILGVLFVLKKRKQFDGQLFPVYLMIYAVGRFIIEFFRGDEARGYLFGGSISHSQFISFFIFSGGALLYFYLRRLSLKSAS